MEQVETMKRIAINVMLADGQKERLQRFVRYRRTMASIIRDAVEQWLKEHEEPPSDH
jgi:predicted DNA-binding protein